MELRQYIAIGLKWWWLMTFFAGLAATTSFVVSSGQTPVYLASTTLIVGQTIQAVDPNNSDIILSQTLARTYADMARRQPVLQGVVENLKMGSSWRALRGRVRARPVPDTQLLEITVEANSPEAARLIADEVAHQLILLSPTGLEKEEQSENRRLISQRVEDLQEKISAGEERVKVLRDTMGTSLSAKQVEELQREINTVESLISGWEDNYTQLLIFIESKTSPNYLAVIEPAQASSSPVRPRTQLNTVLAGVAGLLLALGVIVLMEYLDDTLITDDDISRTLGAVIMGRIAQIKGGKLQNKLIATLGSFSPASEAYRTIRSNIQFLSVDQPVKSILVTSPNPGEGKSLTTANLGIIMAQAGYQTLIVDADLRRPIQHQLFELPNFQGGLTALLRSPELDVKTQLLDSKIVENLQVLTSGVLPPNPAELLGSKRMVQLMITLNDQADVVIFDSPPALAVIDASVIAHRVDGVTLVIEAGRTRRDAAIQAVSNLEKAGANLLGVVLNQVSTKSEGYYHQGYYYTPHIPSSDHQSAQLRSKRRWQWLPFFK